MSITVSLSLPHLLHPEEADISWHLATECRRMIISRLVCVEGIDNPLLPRSPTKSYRTPGTDLIVSRYSLLPNEYPHPAIPRSLFAVGMEPFEISFPSHPAYCFPLICPPNIHTRSRASTPFLTPHLVSRRRTNPHYIRIFLNIQTLL